MSGISDRATAAVARGQARAEELMLDTLAFGTLERAPQDESSGLEAKTFQAVFSTPGKVRGSSVDSSPAVRMVEIGGVERPVVTGGVQIPARRTESVPPGIYVKVTAIGPRTPPQLLNRVYRVEGESVKSWQTARRFDVVEV